jgi:hypothetical protein
VIKALSRNIISPGLIFLDATIKLFQSNVYYFKTIWISAKAKLIDTVRISGRKQSCRVCIDSCGSANVVSGDPWRSKRLERIRRKFGRLSNNKLRTIPFRPFR